MVCNACGRNIGDGEFRYRETEEKFVVQHRECSESDSAWAVRDVERGDQKKVQDEYISDLKAFTDKWRIGPHGELE